MTEYTGFEPEVVCQTCGWEGHGTDLIARTSDMEPGCPSCENNDFLDKEE
jgi:hypothetical protein